MLYNDYKDLGEMNRDFGDKPRGRNDESKRGGLEVIVRRNDVEKAMRILKKKMANEGVLRDLKRKECYEKPSAKRRRQRAEAVSRWRKKQRQLKEEW